MSSTPDRFSVTEAKETDRIESAKPLLAYFIQSTTGVIEHRLQKLLFYTEAVHYSEHGERLTDVNWNPYMYGMYSEDIRSALDEMREDGAEVTRVIRYGKRQLSYLRARNPGEFSTEEKQFLDEIHTELEDVCTADLCQWTKDHPLFDATEWGDVADFSQLPALQD